MLDAEHRDQLADQAESILDAHGLVEPDLCDCGYYVAVPGMHKWHVAYELAEWVLTCP